MGDFGRSVFRRPALHWGPSRYHRAILSSQTDRVVFRIPASLPMPLSNEDRLSFGAVTSPRSRVGLAAIACAGLQIAPNFEGSFGKPLPATRSCGTVAFGQRGSFRACLTPQSVARRNAAGVTPTARRKTFVRCAWSEKPQEMATSARGEFVSRIRCFAR